MSQQIKPINKSLRRIIFWLFVIAFFIISPLIILYTSGYRYNPHSGRLVKTGVLTIDSDPRGATIKLNNELQEKKTPTTIKQLLPGTYELTVEKENYKAWRGKIQIYGGQTTNISNIFLFLDSEPDVLFTKTASSVKPSPTGDTVAYLTNTQGWEEIWLFQPKKNSHTMIGQDIAAGETQLNWSANGHYLSTLNSTRGLMIFNKNGSKLDIDYITTTPLEIFWHPSDDNILYLSDGTQLEEVNLTTNTAKILHGDEDSIPIDASVFTFFDDGSYTELLQIINNNKTVIALLPRSDYQIKMRDENYLILTNSNGDLFLLDIHADTPVLLQAKAYLFSWEKNNNILAYSDGFEIRVYNPNKLKNEFITRQSKKIKNLIWHPNIKNIIVQYDSSITAIEYFQTGQNRQVTSLLPDNDLTILDSWLNKNGNILYYYALQDGAYEFFRLNLSKSLLSF